MMSPPTLGVAINRILQEIYSAITKRATKLSNVPDAGREQARVL